MDLSMPGMGGLRAARKILSLLPRTRVLILTVHTDDAHVFQGIKAGAQGYILKIDPDTPPRCFGLPVLKLQYVGNRWDANSGWYGRGSLSGGGGFAMRVIEREKGHYEVHDVPCGKVYSWCPERVLFECDCGEVLTWTVPVTLCRCGASYTDIPSLEPEERRAKGEVYRQWLEEYEEWRKAKPANDLRHEYSGFLKSGGGD
jgi:CheY-like chemotaxis protein